ncbi:MAG TPA: alpha/beta fold hydrolase [Puia sp.]|nr:alpha/beta fold hydrolase [Puia sp.]
MDRTLTIPPHTIFCRDNGSGIPILLLHGFGEDGTVWQNQVDVLAAGSRLLIPDLPGSGRSSALPASTSLESLAVVIKEVLDQLHVDKVILIGHSMGGYIALAFAARFPERLLAFGLFHSTAYPDSDEKKATRRKAIDFIRANGAAPFIRQSTPNLFSFRTREQRPELVESTSRKYSDLAPASLTGYYEAMIARPDRTAVLREFPRPVLFVLGEDDIVVPLQQGLEQSWLPAISHLHIVKQAGHMAMLEAPEKSNQLISDFINFVSRL